MIVILCVWDPPAGSPGDFCIKTVDVEVEAADFIARRIHSLPDGPHRFILATCWDDLVHAGRTVWDEERRRHYADDHGIEALVVDPDTEDGFEKLELETAVGNMVCKKLAAFRADDRRKLRERLALPEHVKDFEEFERLRVKLGIPTVV